MATSAEAADVNKVSAASMRVCNAKCDADTACGATRTWRWTFGWYRGRSSMKNRRFLRVEEDAAREMSASTVVTKGL
eukprot:3142557-Rhodomonas_salina.2